MKRNPNIYPYAQMPVGIGEGINYKEMELQVVASSCKDPDNLCVACVAESQDLVSRETAYDTLLDYLVHKRRGEFISPNDRRFEPCCSDHEADIAAAMVRLAG